MARKTTSNHNVSLCARWHAAALFLTLGAALTVASPAAHAQSAGTWNKRAQDAEARKDYDTAFEDYRKAAARKPKDLRYRTSLERMRFLAGVTHLDAGRVIRQNGDLDAAIIEFERAITIDPSNQAAQQELDQAKVEQSAKSKVAPLQPQDGEQLPQQRSALDELGGIASPVGLSDFSTDPITLQTVEDSKVIYQTIGKLAGLNVLFDPEFQGKRIQVDLKRVNLADALRILGLQAGAFYRPVTKNTIFVAANTREKHTSLDELAIQTFYLTNASSGNDGNEINTTLRNLIEGNPHVYYIASQNAIVMRGTPDQLMLAQKVLNDLDRARPEVVVDIAILEVNREHIRNLGITLPTSIGLTPSCTTSSTSTACTSTSSTSSTTTTSTTSTGTSSTALTLNGLAHLNATDFAVSITGATVNALLSDSDTRILQNPRIRATDGQKATLTIGQKIPIATGSYSSTLSATTSVGVQTQFQYLDVGVKVELTPTVHYDRQIGLKATIEVSTQTGNVTISGVSEPIIGTNKIDQIIQLKEGEPSVLGGILTKQDSSSASGTPGLGELPILKYIFGSQYKDQAQGEIVFLMIPHLVREPAITNLNVRAIDTGTQNSIELRHDNDETNIANANMPLSTAPAPRASVTSAANAANAVVQQMKQAIAPPVPPAVPAVTKPATNRPPVSLTIQPPNSTQGTGGTFQMAVMVSNAHDLASVPLQLQFDPKILQLVKVDSGELLSRGGQAPVLAQHEDAPGRVTVNAAKAAGSGMEGDGALLVLTFHAVAPGDATVSLAQVGARSTTQANLPAVGSQAVVHVK